MPNNTNYVDPTRPNTIKVFISHKRIPINAQEAGEDAVHEGTIATDQARRLYTYLTTRHGFEVFIDVEKLKRGTDWAQAIFENVRSSDVLLVLLQKNTADSDWIQREVDMARGANIRILPVKIDPATEISRAEERLAISNLQFAQDFDGSDEACELLSQDILRLAQETREIQANWYTQRAISWQPQVAATQLSVMKFPLQGYPNCSIHCTTGDITLMHDEGALRAFDVIVNSENNYMQMARIFDTQRLSGALRMKGAYFNADGELEVDTLQDELDLQIEGKRRLPLADFQVIATHAGHPQSELQRHTRARYVLHAVTVRADPLNNPGNVEVLTRTPAGMTMLIRNIMRRVREIDEKQGVIFPTETPDPNYQPIQRLLLPLFGTGHGGTAPSDAVELLLNALSELPTTDPLTFRALRLTDIYISVWLERDRIALLDALKKRFMPPGTSVLSDEEKKKWSS
jgi:hypothetical protein